jgi:Protein of unknown function (DUF1365)
LTSPRFLNYAFKPASFWLLYTEDRTLTHIVAEVNNTFGERRMYLFKAPPNGSAFKNTMRKDFHVSPFSSRKGSYVLSSSDPMIQDHISLTVTLRSSKEHTKLIANWWSIGPAIDPATVSLLDSLWLIMSWGPTILTTFPKIVFEAVVLAKVCRLQVWYRPEPRETAIPRQPNANEAYLASIFAQYLEFFWAQSEEKYSVSIIPRHENNEGLPGHGRYGLLHMHIAKVDDKSQNLNLTVHSPQFYRQINTCRKLSGLLEMALLDPHVENRTAWSDDAVALVSSARDVERAMEKAKGADSEIDSWFNPYKVIWILYRQVLCVRPLPGVYPCPAIPAARSDIGLRKVCPDSDKLVSELFLDSFIAQELGIGSQLRYMAVALRLRWRTWLVGIIGGE